MHTMCLMATGWGRWGCVSYGLSSCWRGEGLIDRVKDPDPDESEGLVLVMPEVKRLLCIEEEFSKPITAMRREGNTLSAILRAAWDSKPLEVLTRGKSRSCWLPTPTSVSPLTSRQRSWTNSWARASRSPTGLPIASCGSV